MSTATAGTVVRADLSGLPSTLPAKSDVDATRVVNGDTISLVDGMPLLVPAGSQLLRRELIGTGHVPTGSGKVAVCGDLDDDVVADRLGAGWRSSRTYRRLAAGR